MRYINKVQRYASSRILLYFPTSAWNNEVQSWDTSIRYRSMHPPGSYHTSWPQPKTMRYSYEIPQWGTEVCILQDLIILPDLSLKQWGTVMRHLNEVQRYASSRILSYFPTSAWNNEVQSWDTSMRYRGMHPPGSYRTSRPQPETMRYSHEIHQWDTEVCVLQDLIVLPDLSLKQWGTVMRYRGTHPPGSYCTSWPQPETIRYINKVQRYAFSRILSYFPTSAWNNEVQSWDTSMRYRGMHPPGSYRTSRPQPETMRYSHEIPQWDTEVCILQDLIVLPDLSLKQWGTVMRYRGTHPPGSYCTSWPQPDTIRYINKVQRYAFSRILSYFPTSAWNNEVQSWDTSMRYRGMHPPGSYHTSRPQPETMRYSHEVQRYTSSRILLYFQPQLETIRYINKVQRYAFFRILSYFPTSAWNNEVQSWDTSMRYRGMHPPGSYRTSRPQPETMRYSHEIPQWGTDIRVLQDLIILPNLSLKQ